ncbi:MAG: DUF739 family protein [Oscillospiraceae bacterium]|nr:DUF739 family protein [Oscillospiraceae bacterium]
MPEMDYSKLIGRATELGYTKKALAEKIGVSESHFCQKINGHYSFKQKEIREICEILCIAADEIGLYFFTPKVEKSQPYKA